MKIMSQISGISAIAFAAGLSFSLIACEDSSSASIEDSSDSGAALGSSGSKDVNNDSSSSSGEESPASSGSVQAGLEGLPDDVVAFYPILSPCGEDFHPEGSCNSITGADGKEYRFECVGTKWEYNQDCEEPMCLTPASKLQHPECQFPECNADSEGLVHVRVTGSPRFGEGYVFYRCEQGKWVERLAWVECDTAGVTEGELCRVQTRSPGMMGYGGSWNCYKYAGKGTWNGVDCPTEPEKECNAENKGAKEKVAFVNDTIFYRCTEGSKWAELSAGEYYCSSGNESVGDTCSFERDGQKKYFRYDSIPEADSRWVEAAFDPELGFCTENDANYWARAYAKKGDEYYYCSGTAWVATNLVPRQETDPRKEGLTDEEYDVLDLPKDAKVGDRANGLIEYCDYGRLLDLPGATAYDYCFSPNHYRYRGDGSWTAETLDELNEDEIDLDSLPCGGSTWCCAETEGMKRRVFVSFDEPEVIYQCVSEEIKLVEYLWNRYEKK